MGRGIEQGSSLLSAVGRRWALLMIASASLLFFGCAGGSDGDEGSPVEREMPLAGADAGHTADEGNTAGDGGAAGGSIEDPPAPGNARIEVDGQVYEAAVRGCQLSQNAAMVSAQVEVDGEPYDFGLNGQRPADNWTAQAGLTPSANGPSYISANGHVVIDGESILYVGTFSKSGGDSSEDVGEGRVTATCE